MEAVCEYGGEGEYAGGGGERASETGSHRVQAVWTPFSNTDGVPQWLSRGVLPKQWCIRSGNVDCYR
jgi:hypothetical protein